MKQATVMAALIITLLPCQLLAGQGAKRIVAETLAYENYGGVRLYRESPHPSRVVLFLSGLDGWNERVSGMASALASLDSLVIGVDASRFLKSFADDGERCSYYTWSLEDLSHYTQQKLGFPNYVSPILAGYAAGATIAYAALVEAHAGTFRGALSLGFCPGLSLRKPPCRGDRLQWQAAARRKGARESEYLLRPDADLADPWIVLQGNSDAVCEYKTAEAFVKQTGHARIVGLPGVGRGFSDAGNWMPQLKTEFSALVRTIEQRVSAPKAPEVKDLPLVEIPAAGSGSDALAVIVSGDGGWASIDRDLGQMLSSGGISVVGLNSLQYFWTRRTPDTASADLDRILRHYLTSWNKRRVILVGYSMGADVLAFMAARLSPDLLSKLALIALLGPSPSVDFEFHFVAWVSSVSRKTDLRVAPEVEKLKGKKIFCVYGVQEEETLCRMLPPGLVRPVAMRDGHHFGGDYKTIADLIFKEAK